MKALRKERKRLISSKSWTCVPVDLHVYCCLSELSLCKFN